MITSVPELGYERDVSQYTVQGQRVVSVTEALQIAGVINLSGIPVDFLDEAAKRGKAAHRGTMRLDLGQIELEADEIKSVRGYCDAWLKFKAAVGFECLMIETAVVSTPYRFAGTLDRFGYCIGHAVPYLIDLKCTASIAPWVGLQLAGYKRALIDMGWPLAAAAKRIAVRLLPDGRFVQHTFTSHSDEADFLACVRIATWRLNHKEVCLP